MKIAVDVCVGHRGVKALRDAGHDVLEAEHAEPDRSWFERARAWGVELVVSADADLEILCYDHDVRLLKPGQGEYGLDVGRRAARAWRCRCGHVNVPGLLYGSGDVRCERCPAARSTS